MAVPKITKHILLAVMLTAYVAIVALISLPHYRETGNWVEFWVIASASEAVILLLVYVLRKRDKARQKRKGQY